MSPQFGIIAFTGRESDAPFGVWGAIAGQFEKKDQFKDYYSPLQAPGQTAWERLLAGETALILLDELVAAISDFEKETNRTAMHIEPVRINTDELYHILRTRLFSKLPSEMESSEVAQGYAKAIREAKQIDITNESPEQFGARVHASYPFHPAIRDLYARFRENAGFQQRSATPIWRK